MPEIGLGTLQGWQNLDRDSVQTFAGVAKISLRSDWEVCRGGKNMPEIRFGLLQGLQKHA